MYQNAIFVYIYINKRCKKCTSTLYFKIFIMVVPNTIFGYIHKKLQKVLIYNVLLRLHYRNFKILFLGTSAKTIVESALVSSVNCTMGAPKPYFLLNALKFAKSAPVSPIMKIKLWIHKNPIIGYICTKFTKSDLVTPLLKLHYRCTKPPLLGICAKRCKKYSGTTFYENYKYECTKTIISCICSKI